MPTSFLSRASGLFTNITGTPGPGSHAAIASPASAPAPEAVDWMRAERWLWKLETSQYGTYRDPAPAGLSSKSASEMTRALKALPAELLLPDDVVTRNTALAVLETAPRSWRFGRRGLIYSQKAALDEAIRLGDACMLTGPERSRRPRSVEALAALRELTAWARRGIDPRQRTAFVMALRAPQWRDKVPVARWHEPDARSGELGPLALPPRHMIDALIGRDPVGPELQTYSFRIDDPQGFARSIAAFAKVILQPLRIPSAHECLRLPGGITDLNLSRLPIDIEWPALGPLLSRLTALRGLWGLDEQLSGEPPDSVRDWSSIPETLGDLAAVIRHQILGLHPDHAVPLYRELVPRLDRLMEAATGRPTPDDDVRAALHRETGHCLEANLSRLDEIDSLLQAGPLHSLADKAQHFFREALRFRSGQTAADRHRNYAENLEIGQGLAWAVDQRLVALLGLRAVTSKPVYACLARLPGHVDDDDDGPVNDTRAADDLIGSEIREGFPTLALFASGGHAMSAWMADALEEDEAFRRARSAIEAGFQNAYAQAFDLAPDDLEVGTQLFLHKEAELTRARVERFTHHLQPALARLRAAGIGEPRPQTSSHSTLIA